MHTQKLVKQETVSLVLSDLPHHQMTAHMTHTLNPMHAIPKKILNIFSGKEMVMLQRKGQGYFGQK